MRVAKFIDIIKSFGGYLRVDNKAGYKEDYELDDLGDNDFITKQIFVNNAPEPVAAFPYNLPANSETPIIINFVDGTIKIGSASPVDIGTDLTVYQQCLDVKFDQIIDSLNTKPVGNEGWISNKKWTDNTYTIVEELTLQPDTDTGLPGGLTLDNINIIIKP